MDFTLPTRRPLVPIDTAVFYLDRHPEEVTRECDALWAWDIAGPGAQRRQLRIWRNSLIALKNPAERRNIPGRIDEVIESFLPQRGIRGSELQVLFYCTPQHIGVLDAAGLLEVERERPVLDGPRSSRVYTRQSIAGFLTRRSLSSDNSSVRPLHPDSRN